MKTRTYKGCTIERCPVSGYWGTTVEWYDGISKHFDLLSAGTLKGLKKLITELTTTGAKPQKNLLAL